MSPCHTAPAPRRRIRLALWAATLALACAADVPPEPVATGYGVLRSRITLYFDGPPSPEIPPAGGEIFNSATGRVVDGNGDTWFVKGTADFSLAPGGVPAGDPTEFVSLTVRRLGR